MSNFTVAEFVEQVAQFNQRRGWDRTHTGARLLIALMTEIGELSEIYKWQTTETSFSESRRSAIGDELADVMIYCACIALTEGVNLPDAVIRKLSTNNGKYPPSEPGR